jgi:hypothetical protein
MRTPYQLLFNKVPDLSNMLIFGCKAEAYIDGQVRRKGGDRSRPGIFVGYDEKSKAYKFLPAGETKWMAVRTLICNEKDMVNVQEEKQGLIELETEVFNGIQQRGQNLNQLEEKEEAKENKVGEDGALGDGVGSGEFLAEPKTVEREQLKAAKSERRVTRSQLQSQLNGHMAMVVVDGYGAEHHVPGHGINLEVPKSISGAFNGPEASQWKQAVKEEMDAIHEAKTLSGPVVLPEGARAVPLKFIFAKKLGADGKIERFKARLVFNHSSKDETGEDNYSPVVDRVSLRIFLAAVAEMGWELCQADVKTAFLNADNPGKEFVRLPVEVVGSESERTRILLKALYGLQRAPNICNLGTDSGIHTE